MAMKPSGASGGVVDAGCRSALVDRRGVEHGGGHRRDGDRHADANHDQSR